MIRLLLPTLIVLGLSAQPGQAQTINSQEKAPPAQSVRDRAEMLAKYKPWCGKPLALPSCVDEIIRVEKEILSR
jgi:hypothetical protein